MTTTNSPDWAAATRAIDEAGSILVVTHLDPDGDAIGTLLGLTTALRERGRRVDAAVDGGVPDFLRFIAGSDTVHARLDAGAWDVMISTDSSDEARTGDVGAYGRAHSRRVVNLDHHATNTGFGDLHLVVPTAVSASEIVLAWLTAMRHPLTREVATALLCGLVTDTRGFRTSNVTAATLGHVQTLMAAGASLTEVTQRALDTYPYAQLELWKHALQSVRLDGAVVSAVIRQADLARAGMDAAGDGGQLVSMLLAAEEARISVVFKETAKSGVELSFRAKPGYDVASVAFGLGGGGHTQASGATVSGSLDDVRARVMPLLQAAAAQGRLSIT